MTNEEIELQHIQLELHNNRSQHLRHFIDQYYCYKNGYVSKNGKAKWEIWKCVLWAIFDVQTSCGCLKVSEFDQEFISEVKDH